MFPDLDLDTLRDETQALKWIFDHKSNIFPVHCTAVVLLFIELFQVKTVSISQFYPSIHTVRFTI